MSTTVPRLDASLSVNDAIRHFPATLPVLNRFGIDTCCGGAEPLAQAAESCGVPVTALMSALLPAALVRDATSFRQGDAR